MQTYTHICLKHDDARIEYNGDLCPVCSTRERVNELESGIRQLQEELSNLLED